jgi:hypothetical protein
VNFITSNMENRDLREEWEMARKWRNSAHEDYRNAVQKVNHVSMQLAKGNGGTGDERKATGGLENRSPAEKIQPLEGKPVPEAKIAPIPTNGRVIPY